MKAHPKRDDIERLIVGRTADPHALLGQHPLEGRGVGLAGPQSSRSVVIRAWRPQAQTVSCLSDGVIVAKLEQVHPAGLFEATLDAPLDSYEFEVTYGDGQSYAVADSYAFLPTLGELDVHLIGEGSHRRLYETLGSHVRTVDGVEGVAFAVWAPSAEGVRVVGDFNGWDANLNPMRVVGSSGVWELFVPGAGDGCFYKFDITTPDGSRVLKTDPFAFATEVPPGTAARVFTPQYEFQDADWVDKREGTDHWSSPMSVYELHLGSWRKGADGAALSYREAGTALAAYCKEMGFTHVEFLPLAEHPFGGSWGYQVSHYFAPTARFGDPDDLRALIDALHAEGIGVLVDWVPAHFPKDEWALARFDGTALYEHLDPRLGEHPDWGTYVFNFGRNEVRNFLISNALFWIDEFHVDGLRVDAVASMLYLDYSREEGEWVPNRFGGNENIEAIEFLRELNSVIHEEHPGVLMIAEESTAWSGVSRPVHLGGLGFDFKWNMGWMHDTLKYFSKDPIHRRFHHNNLTFSLIYAYSENFALPLSHDEVVHGKGSLINKMPGDRWQQRANLRSLYGYMWAHPGKKLLFMGGELGQDHEWNHDDELEWFLLESEAHAGISRLVADLNRVYTSTPALWEKDHSPEGFSWIDANDADNNVLSFFRSDEDQGRHVVCVCNLSPIVRGGFRIGLPALADYTEVVNTDAAAYGGSNVGNMGVVKAEPIPWHGLEQSAMITLPPLAVLWLST